MEKEGSDLKPLQAIKNIEMTLLQLKSKINVLQKEELRTAQNIENLFTSAAPIIKKKLYESAQVQKIVQKCNSFMSKQKNRQSLARRNRLEQEQHIASSKIQMNQSKAFQSMHIKELSKKNQEVIAEGRRRVLEKKRQKRDEVRQLEDKGKNRIHDFHILKKYGFKKEKEEERKIMMEKIEQSRKKVKALQRQEKLIAERAQKNKAIFLQLRQVSDYLHKLKPTQFAQISKKLDLSGEQALQDEEIQQILYQLQEQMKISKKSRITNSQCKRGISSIR